MTYSTKNPWRWLLFTGLTAFATGCGGPTLADSIDFDFDFSTFNSLSPKQNDLHSPYVVGSKFSIYGAYLSRDEKATHTVLASPSTGLDCIADTHAGASCTATRAGSGEVTLVDEKGNAAARGDVEVLVPDSFEALPNARLLVSPTEEVKPLQKVKVLVGGTTTAWIRFKHKAQTLNGNGTLGVRSDSPALKAWTEKTFLFEDRDWVQFTASATGKHAITITANGSSVGTLEVEAVNLDEVKRIDLEGDTRAKYKEDALITLVGRAFDSQGGMVYGVDFDWDLDGKPEPGEGDVFRYRYDSRASSILTAKLGALSAQTNIRADSGYVTSSNKLGCATSPPGQSSGLAFGLGLGALGCVISARRLRGRTSLTLKATSHHARKTA